MDDMPDFTPDQLNVSDLATIVSTYYNTVDDHPRLFDDYHATFVMWEALTGLPDEQARAYAHQIAESDPPVLAFIPEL